MATFIALIFILNYLLYKPILSIIDRRKKQLEELENEIKLFKDSVDKKAAEYDEKLNKAKAGAAKKKIFFRTVKKPAFLKYEEPRRAARRARFAR